MRLNLLKKISALALSISASLSHADNKILYQDVFCPALDKVQASANKLDSSQKINDRYYIAYTATSFFQENNIWWFSGVGNIIATSNGEAITIGKKILKDANTQIDIYPTKVGNEYICNYAPGYIQARGKDLT